MTTSDRRREDVFVSIGIIVSQNKPDPAISLEPLIAKLSAQFRYWELLFVVNADSVDKYESLLRMTPNMRLLKVRRETPGFRRRLCVANEAIGDILVISAPEEIEQVDILDLVSQCEASETIITVRRASGGVGAAPLIALGRSAGFQVDMRDMVTAAYPRSLVNRLLRHPDAALAMRFPPLDRNIPVQIRTCKPSPGYRQPRSSYSLLYRMRIVQQLVISSAPRVLGLVELLSMGVGIAAMLFAVYATIVWLTFKDVQAGWFTTSLILSMTAMFLGFAILGLSLGLQRMLDLLAHVTDEDVLDEVASIDLFATVAQDLNIEFDSQADAAKAALVRIDGQNAA